MIVDCHTHVNLDAGDKGCAEHLTATEALDACVVLPSLGPDRQAINTFVSQHVRAHKDRMIGFALIDPTADDVSAAGLKDRMQEWGMQGVVVYCAASGFHPSHSHALCLYEVAQEQGWPVFFHNGDLERKTEGNLSFAQPMLLDEIAQMYPDLKMVIGSMGRPFVEQTLLIIGRHKNVYADLAIRPACVWQTYNMIVAAHERQVMDKLLFGSAYPPGRVESCIETLLGFNMMFADTNLPTVPRGLLRNVVERPTLEVLGLDAKAIKTKEHKDTTPPNSKTKSKT